MVQFLNVCDLCVNVYNTFDIRVLYPRFELCRKYLQYCICCFKIKKM